jgi:hypothetical protein
MKNIHILPTTQKSKIFFNHNKGFEKYQFSKEPFINGLTNTTNQNIYITSDEEIKEGDYIYENNLNNETRVYMVEKRNDRLLFFRFRNVPIWLDKNRHNCKKIILTTDQDLIKDGVQTIPDEFLEWFVKNPSCEELKIGIEIWNDGTFSYRIIIPNEESKLTSTINKDELGIPKGNLTGLIGVNKQETLEEAAEKFRSENPGTMQGGNNTKILNAFKSGVKWQQEPEQFFSDDRVKTLEKSIEYLLKRQERSYSEEEVKHLMTLSFEQGFKKADVVEAGLEAKETDTEVNWIFLKHKK